MNRYALPLVALGLLAGCATAPPPPLTADNPASPSAPEAIEHPLPNAVGVDKQRMIYFAYGSNLLTARILSRCSQIKKIARASLGGYTLRSDKRGRDGSGRCTVHSTGNAHDIVYGVLFYVTAWQVCCLDRAEGEGVDYDRKVVRVEAADAELVPAETYIGKEAKIDQDAKPYDWYLALVITAAVMHNLPQTYTEALRKVQGSPNPDLNRPERLEALKQLGKST